MSRFLWTGSSDPHNAKVAWDRVCKPKQQGGLGLKKVTEWNHVALMKHIWHLFFDLEDVVWAQKVMTYLLRGESFWYVEVLDKFSWVWRCLLSINTLFGV